MSLIQKNDVNQIFASQAPDQDKPAKFDNYNAGWGVESRPNNGKPTIKGFNYIQQRTDQNILWIHQNGGGLPYDPTIQYTEGAIVTKDGFLKKKSGSEWIDPVDIKPPLLGREFSQADVDKLKGYPLHAELMLDNGDRVVSTIPNNTNNPNIDMTGWIKTNSASYIVDESGLSQNQINSLSSSVKNVAELRKIKAKNNDVVKTIGHTIEGLGSGIYIFEALSSKQDNNGSYVASSVASGTWVLISDNLYFEHFGVINDGTDQSSKMQACLDYAQSVNIKNIQFEKPNEYAIANRVWVKPQPLAGATVQQPQVKTIIKFNGAVLRLLSDNQIGVEVSREYIRLENPSFITTKSGCVGIFNGLSDETIDSPIDTSIRRSSQFMELIAPCGQGLDVGVKFKPAKRNGNSAWGAYYHKIYDYSFNSTNIAFMFDESFDNLNATTRVRFFGGTHLRGACTFYCLNAETIEVFGYSSEIITRTDARLPDSEACVIYFPRTSTNSTLSNGFSKFYGDIEVCTNYYNIEAYRVEVDGRFMSASGAKPAKYDSQSWRNGGLRRTNLAAEAISAEKGQSAQLKLSRTSNPTDEGGVKAELLMGEKSDGSGFYVRGSGDVTDNHFDINFPKLTEPAHNELRSNVGSRTFYNFGATQGLRLTFGGIMRLHEANNNAFDVGDLRFSEASNYIAPQRKADGTISLGLPQYKFKEIYSKQIVLQPPKTATPLNNGELVFELASDTQLKIKVKGSDGVIRSATINLDVVV